ncbi:MAG: 30S ribosomal protein S20 [candidate division Zixibacteria bacterium]|nr:30S ribosomal protein S20 [candidate division Zixibacteria bacterium]
MPNHKSCAKRVKTSDKERLRNRVYRTKLRIALKEIRSEKNKEAATVQYRNITKIIDKAAAYGLIHRKNADRNKSRLAIHVNKLT